ncbi:MAG TPA: HEAT repeat domain-containing protein [Pyrinomonadaceae bacterium]|nr:HEAT repeat domain-containing protein [Pyrinomonadaceae bacterium]
MGEGQKIEFNFVPAIMLAAGAILFLFSSLTYAQSSRNLTPLQAEIEKQQQRLNSGDEEERRDALMRLGALHRAEASRVALPALSDPSPIIRVTAAKAILSLDPAESAAALLPLLNDKDEFVRRETAYSLGQTRSRTATAALSERLLNDKEAGVRGAAAVALGRIADEAGVVALASTLAPELSAPVKSKRKREENEFVLRAAAEALGQIKSRAGTQALISAVGNEKFSNDVRREAARALGLIADPAAIPALKSVSTAADPFLSQLAYESLRKISRTNP